MTQNYFKGAHLVKESMLQDCRVYVVGDWEWYYHVHIFPFVGEYRKIHTVFPIDQATMENVTHPNNCNLICHGIAETIIPVECVVYYLKQENPLQYEMKVLSDVNFQFTYNSFTVENTPGIIECKSLPGHLISTKPANQSQLIAATLAPNENMNDVLGRKQYFQI